MRLLSLLFAALISLTGCSSDYGVSYTVEENVLGEVGYEFGTSHAQAMDIAFLVDESCSMADDQEELASYMPAIYDMLTGPLFTDLEWGVHISATDSSQPVYASVYWDDPDADIKLLTLTSFLGGAWASAEAGLDAAVHQVAWENIYRDDADLLFVFISDEPDQSSISVSAYEQVMDQVKKDPFLVTESAIVFTGNSQWNDGECVDSGDTYSLGTGYIDVSEVVISLCDSGWDRALDVVREHVPTLNEKWPLTDGTPVSAAHINVYLDDVETNNWTYNQDENAVYLTRIPKTGTDIAITYLIAPEEE